MQGLDLGLKDYASRRNGVWSSRRPFSTRQAQHILGTLLYSDAFIGAFRQELYCYRQYFGVILAAKVYILNDAGGEPSRGAQRRAVQCVGMLEQLGKNTSFPLSSVLQKSWPYNYCGVRRSPVFLLRHSRGFPAKY